MRRLFLALLASTIAWTGCASGMRAPQPGSGAGGLAEVIASDETPAAIAASTIRDTEIDMPSPLRATSPGNALPGATAQASSASHNQPDLEPYDPAEPFLSREEIVTPAPAEPTPFKPKAEDEADLDRFNRTILDVEVDIRPTSGVMPEDRGAERFANEPVIDESLPSGEPADVLCAYTPWTICYRPLYFEDIALERYDKNVGYLQTGLSGVRFFGSIAALPYKMTRRPPRSCECSNGFSRPGDCPLPGYGNRRLELDAALVEAAAVTAVVYFIP